MVWNVGELKTREEAITLIKQMAREKGYTQSFKVVYDGQEVITEASLPAQVDMSKVEIADKLNNA